MTPPTDPGASRAPSGVFAFDPASAARIKHEYAGFVEVTLAPSDLSSDGYRLIAHDGEGLPIAEFLLRPDFLEALIAARAREADAA